MKYQPTMSYKNYIAIFVSVITLLAGLYLTEVYWLTKFLPNGLIVGGLQCIVSLGAGICLLQYLRGSGKNFLPLLFLSLAFFSFALADFFWAYLFYFVELSRYHWLSVLFIQFPYGTGYFFMSASMISGLRIANNTTKTAKRYFVTYLLVTVPFFVRYIVIPTITLWQTSDELFFVFGHTFNIINAFVLANVALITITIDRQLAWSLIATGCAALILENWSFRAEMIHWNTPSYGFYDYLWSFGILIAAFPIIYGRLVLKQKHFTQIQNFESNSLVSQSRFWIIASVLVALSILTIATSPQLLIIRFVCVGSVVGLVFSIFLGQFLAEKIEKFAVLLTHEVTGQLCLDSNKNNNNETLPLELRNVYSRVFEQKLIEQRKQQQLKDEIAIVSAQVAHDIRSPIAALTVVTQMLENVPEEQRILIRQAVQRIEDIANDLASTKSKSDSNSESTDSKSTVPQMVSGILDLIVSEKRMQYRSRGGIRIDCNINDKSYGLFANIHENTFKRVFSNLINNAVEALGENGHIEVNLLSADEKNLLIQVRDNGKGIPADILPKLMQRGETHGKSGGKGLGLYHARATMEEWGGSMVLSSTVGQGTLIEIQLPKVPAPDWFLPELKLGAATRVVVIDDDSSIHQIWTGRFKAPQYKNNEIVHYSSADAVLKAFEKSPEIFSGDYVVLCDMELRGEDISGLALLRRVKATDHAVLVTSRFEEPHVRSECKELGIKLIPKNLAGFVPIIVESVGANCVRPQIESQLQSQDGSPQATRTDVVLIDDQDMIHTTWKMMAKVKKINLQSFHTAEEFFSTCGTLDKNCSIFIDSNLADGVKGEVIAKDIHARGFENIYLATGSDASEFPPMPWIKKVVGKQPLFSE